MGLDGLQAVRAVVAEALAGFAWGHLLWSVATAMAYGTARWLYLRGGSHPLLLPAVTGSAMVGLALWASGTPHQAYLTQVSPLLCLMGPATVALAVPLFGQLSRLKAIWWPVSVALLAGSLAAIGTTLLSAWALGGGLQGLISLAPKSATMPIATSLSQQFGGLAGWTAAAVALTGLAGTVLAGPVLRWALGPLDDAVQGFALGLSAHAIGTARAVQIGETAGAFAAMAMGLNGLLTALWMPWAVAVAQALATCGH